MAEANKKPTLDHNSTANAQYDVAANDQDGRKMSKQLTSIGEDEYGNAIPRAAPRELQRRLAKDARLCQVPC